MKDQSIFQGIKELGLFRFQRHEEAWSVSECINNAYVWRGFIPVIQHESNKDLYNRMLKKLFGHQTKYYVIALTVDNNRYGAYYKCYASRTMLIQASNRRDAYYIAAYELRKEKRYKNVHVRNFENQGDHDFSSWSINFKASSELTKEQADEYLSTTCRQ